MNDYFTALLAYLEPPAWTKRALCRRPEDYDLFFPESGNTRPDLVEFCGNCDVQAECLSFALDHDEPHGIWGGLNRIERRRLKTPEARQAALDSVNNRQKDKK